MSRVTPKEEYVIVVVHPTGERTALLYTASHSATGAWNLLRTQPEPFKKHEGYRYETAKIIAVEIT